jgi:hypothetical protein
MYRESNEPLLVKIIGLPRLIGKAQNTRTIYLYRPDSMAGLVLWIPVFTGKTIPGGFRQSVNGFD